MTLSEKRRIPFMVINTHFCEIKSTLFWPKKVFLIHFSILQKKKLIYTFKSGLIKLLVSGIYTNSPNFIANYVRNYHT